MKYYKPVFWEYYIVRRYYIERFGFFFELTTCAKDYRDCEWVVNMTDGVTSASLICRFMQQPPSINSSDHLWVRSRNMSRNAPALRIPVYPEKMKVNDYRHNMYV